eukprot:6492806-Amphidinium_carterae.3
MDRIADVRLLGIPQLCVEYYHGVTAKIVVERRPRAYPIPPSTRPRAHPIPPSIRQPPNGHAVPLSKARWGTRYSPPQ